MKVVRVMIGHLIALSACIYLFGQFVDILPVWVPMLEKEEMGGQAIALAYLTGRVYHWIMGEIL